MIPRRTEDWVTIYLKEKIEKKVPTEAFLELKTPVGMRKPDLFCQNGGKYVIEAKFHERDLWKAVAKIQNDYLKYHKLLDLDGGFAILYPSELSRELTREQVLALSEKLNFKLVMLFLPEDVRKNFHVVEGNITDISREICNQILTPPEYIDPSVSYIIETLRDMANSITQNLKHLSGDQLQDLFGGKDVFENILQYAQNEYPEEDLRIATAYILVNQILFYQVIQKKMPDLFDEIDSNKLKKPSDLNTFFSKVLDVNYKAIFTYDVASRMPRENIDEIKIMVAAIQAIGAEKIGGDLLGTIFHDLIPFEIRKKIAAYYTNPLAAEFLAMLTIEDENVKVADFACGSGGLLVASYRQKKRLIESKRTFISTDHIRFVEKDHLGVDVMPFAANIAASHLALQSPEYFTNKIQFAVWDSTELLPNTTIPSMSHIKYGTTGQQLLEAYSKKGQAERKKGGVQLTKEDTGEIKLTKYDLIIMNPPFTRQERITKEYKDLLYERFADYKDYLDGQMSYYGYFLLLADKFIKKEGKLAFVLPAAFLRNQSVRSLRQYIIQNYNIDYIISGYKKLNFSEATWRREILFVASKNEIEKTKVLLVPEIPEKITAILKLAHKISKTNKDYENDDFRMKIINKEELKSDLDWFRFISSLGEMDLDDVWKLIISKSSILEPFSNVYDIKHDVKRGIETARGMKVQYYVIPSSEKRAIRNEDMWILDHKSRDHIIVTNRDATDIKIDIPNDDLDVTLRTLSDNSTIDVKNNHDFVVIKDFLDSKKFFISSRKKYIELLPQWERYVSSRKGNLLIFRRFPIYAPGTYHLALYSKKKISGPGTTWVADIDDDDAKILSLWFNSTINLAQIFRERVEDVWMDLHKWILTDMLIINPKKIEKENKVQLLKLFDEISVIEFPSLHEQYETNFGPKMQIDKVFLEILGFNKKEINDIIDSLYGSIKIQFEYIKEFMDNTKKK